MTKTQRQHRMSDLLEREVISTAAQLVTRLQSEGMSATQATVTRDLQELGTIKVRDEHGARRIVAAEVADYLTRQRMAEVTPTVTALRQRAADAGHEIKGPGLQL